MDDSNMLPAMEELRKQALKRMAQTNEWQIIKGLDDAIEAAGGKRSLPQVGGVNIHKGGELAPLTASAHGGRRLSQGDAAEAVLREQSSPLPIADLLPRIEARGVAVGGERKEINLSSSLSRDDRFDSVRVNGVPMWKLKDMNSGSQAGVLNLGPEGEELQQ